MSNNWVDSYTVTRLLVGKYISLVTNWKDKQEKPEHIDSGYITSISFNPVRFTTIYKDREEAQKDLLLKTKFILEKMLIDMNKAIEEEGKEE